MKKELQNMLSEYLGELLYQHENTFDWADKDKITLKINAVYELLEIRERKKIFSDAIKDEVLYKSKCHEKKTFI